jgi:hypothetical protein
MFFANKNSISGLAVVLISSSFLAGCNNEGSNPQESTASNKSQNMLHVVNHSGSAIDHFQIIESGIVIFSSNNNLQCASNQKCSSGINTLVTSSNMVAKFYDKNNQLINIAQLDNNSDSLKYMTVHANSTILGANLFQQLVAFEQSNSAAVLKQLNSFFKISSSNHTNVFTTLGDYYQQQLKIGNVKTEQNFYQQMSKNFVENLTATLPIPSAWTASRPTVTLKWM